MIKIAIVEDEPSYASLLEGYIEEYSKNYDKKISVKLFSDGLDITDEYKAEYDIIFMDIEMKHMDGMKAAEVIRKYDSEVIIIFITNLSQYAIAGYRVDAMNYILKPIEPFAFFEELNKAIKKASGGKEHFILIKSEGNTSRISLSDIYYIESGSNHRVVYHTVSGELSNRDSIKNAEESLKKYHFSKCNSGSLVNLEYVERVEANIVYVKGVPLQISRMKKKKFMEELADYIGG